MKSRRKSMILDLAEEVLEKATEPLTYLEIWNAAKSAGIPERLGIRGQTPQNTLSSRLGSDIEKPNSRFFIIRTFPRRFFLESRRGELMQGVPEKKHAPKSNEKIESQSKVGFLEKELHPLLAYFAHRSPEFWGERKIYTKTIEHTVSKRSPLKEEWMHPDMAGVYFPFEDMTEKVIDLHQRVGLGSLVRFYSFELKRELTAANCRKSFFQAVSNSSWAHEGYLVAADIKEEDIELKRELERLSNSFGIGIISLDRNDIDASKIVYPAKLRSSLDWETINKLYDRNVDFRKFIDDVQGDIKSRIIHPQQYDDILDPD